MAKKILAVLFVVLFICSINFTCANDEAYVNQTFDDYFTMEVPLAYNFTRANETGSLGCLHEYYDRNSDGNFRNGTVVVYYYDNSLLDENESDVLDHVLDDLTATYAYNLNQNDEDLIILENDADMCGIPAFLAGKSNGNGEVVFIGGQNLHELESYADTIVFQT